MNPLHMQAIRYLDTLEQLYVDMEAKGELNPFAFNTGCDFARAMGHSQEPFTPCAYYMRPISIAVTPKQETVLEFRCSFERIDFNQSEVPVAMDKGRGVADNEFTVVKVHAKPISPANLRKFLEIENTAKHFVDSEELFNSILRDLVAIRWSFIYSYVVAAAFATMGIVRRTGAKVFAPRINGFGLLEWHIAFDGQLVTYTFDGDKLAPELAKLMERIRVATEDRVLSIAMKNAT